MSGGLSIKIDVRDAAVRNHCQGLLARVKDRRRLHRAIGRGALELTRDYLTALGETRHRTAEALGAEPTNYFDKAAKNTSMTSDAESATVSVRAPGITRSARAITIRPTDGREWLTLPLTGAAYGHTVSQVERTLGVKLFRPVRKGAKSTGYHATTRGTGGHTFKEEDKMNVLASAVPGAKKGRAACFSFSPWSGPWCRSRTAHCSRAMKATPLQPWQM